MDWMRKMPWLACVLRSITRLLRRTLWSGFAKRRAFSLSDATLASCSVIFFFSASSFAFASAAVREAASFTNASISLSCSSSRGWGREASSSSNGRVAAARLTTKKRLTASSTICCVVPCTGLSSGTAFTSASTSTSDSRVTCCANATNSKPLSGLATACTECTFWRSTMKHNFLP
eukprot:Mycagemm_TRINITY_DN10054_c0_g2::TRINITY_DN10054_c0_g2_i1::g.2032::m.2032 type:complete len:176 gc:universal TRINITY_DN10054_c0_g2_i1:638-1165(+)